MQNIHVVETHISWVVLTGPYAYKIKKPVNLGFLDFSTLDKRRFYCEEELRLNRRLAEALYLGVIPITGSPASPRLNGSGEAIEYAVKMVQFSEEARLDRMLARGELQAIHIDLLAQELAGFHDRVAVAGGRPKLDAVRAALAGRFMNVLVTDEDVATALLRPRQPAGVA